MAIKKSLPKSVAVAWDDGGSVGDEPFLIASENVDGLADGGEWRYVGVYALQRVVRVRRVTETQARRTSNPREPKRAKEAR